jgi:GTP diphosphokinase / guanosine-3',5'-bis(diphosphate) 3'-diphosphatase
LKTGSLIDDILAKTASHFFAPTYHPEQPKKFENIEISAFFGELQTVDKITSEDINFVKRVFYFADRVHLGQYRNSGEPYITHPLAVARICIAWRLDKYAICAALLHDVMEDQGVTKNELIAEFGLHIADLVEGLTKLTHIEFNSKEEEKAANFERLLSSSVKDHKVLLVKIADRLHNMRTLDYMLPEKQKLIAKETQEIYAPFAKCLGLHDAYNELQNLSFLYYCPWRYHIMQKALASQVDESNHFIKRITQKINISLTKNNIHGLCYGRMKMPHIVYAKLLKQKKHYENFKFKDMKDLLTFEIIVTQKLDCYKVIGLLHHAFKPKPGRFKDYIALPKSNGYRALHTTLIDNTGRSFHIQIRTKRMQKIAQSGITAFLDNVLDIDDDEDNENIAHNMLTQSLSMLASLQELKNQAENSKELLYYTKINLSSDEIVVFDEVGNPVLIPRESTALDFAYHISYQIGNATSSIEINGVQADFAQNLKTGDLIKIKTNTEVIPELKWLKIVKTSRAKIALQHFFKYSK